MYFIIVVSKFFNKVIFSDLLSTSLITDNFAIYDDSFLVA